MTSTKGQKPAAIRDTNIKLVMRMLAQNTHCRSELAKRAKLSNPALTAIIEQLIRMGLIAEGKEVETNMRGRRKVDLMVNNRYAAVAAVDFSSDNIQIVLADFVKNVFVRREIVDSEIITREVLAEVIRILREEIDASDIPVKCICVGVPGKINSKTGKVHMAAYKYRGCTDVNIVKLFEEELGVPTVIANDASLQMLAEKRDDGERTDSALLYIDYGMGGALWLYGENFEGDRGLAAELGAVPFIIDGNAAVYEDVCGINAMLGYCDYKPDDAVSFDAFAAAYERGSEKEVEALRRSARCISLLVRCLVGITGCNDFIIGGKISRFGEEYLQLIKDCLRDEKIFDLSMLEIRYGKHLQDGTVVGAIDKAIAFVIDTAVKER